jgi:hypothetical protein
MTQSHFGWTEILPSQNGTNIFHQSLSSCFFNLAGERRACTSARGTSRPLQVPGWALSCNDFSCITCSQTNLIPYQEFI